MAYPSDLSRTKNWGNEVLTDSDLEGQFDLIINWVDAFADETSGHKHDGTSNEGPKIDLTASVTGTLPVTNGGTGQATLAAFLNLIYPVGSVYTNATDSTNPGTLLGFGTWVAIEGECVVGYKSGDGDFGSVGSVAAGEKTHTLTEAEMPAHTHGVQTFSGGATQGNGTSSNTNPSGATGSTGGGGAHNNIQPSYVCYVWRRTV